MDQEKNNSTVAEQRDATLKDALKLKKKSASLRKTSEDFRKYTKQIWLAGLGAFSRVEEEGNKLFETLVKVGEELESTTEQVINQHLNDAEQNSIQDKHSTKTKVDKLLDHSVHHSLSRLGLVTVQDLQYLESLIVQLHHKVDLLAEENQELKMKLRKTP